MQMEKKTVWITGADRGVGFSLCEEFLRGDRVLDAEDPAAHAQQEGHVRTGAQRPADVVAERADIGAAAAADVEQKAVLAALGDKMQVVDLHAPGGDVDRLPGPRRLVELAPADL